jgi:hypothetical protein
MPDGQAGQAAPEVIRDEERAVGEKHRFTKTRQERVVTYAPIGL